MIRGISKIKIALLILSVFVFGILVFFLNIRAACKVHLGKTLTIGEEPLTIKKIREANKNYSRPEESTYLTFPEWYIVYSAEEYARVLEKNRPSQFSYFSAISQYWCTYNRMYEVTKGRYPFNFGDHAALLVIGVSFSAENAVKGIYENTFGRISEWFSFGGTTEEDIYAANVAREYGSFLYTIPWYEFPFGEKLKDIWRTTSLWGAHPVRKWERKFILSLEYSIKSVYGFIIKKATKATYGNEDAEIMLWIENIPKEVLEHEPRIHIVQHVDENTQIVVIPRYKAFTEIVSMLAREKIQFKEIAGNNEILLTAIAPQKWKDDLKDSTLLFAMNILTEQDQKRLAIESPAKSLQNTLTSLEASGVKVEHIYDY